MAAEDEDRSAKAVPAAPPVRRRGPRRATGGTFSGAEPRSPGPGGPPPEPGEEAAEQAHEQWLRDQRPPHWG